jgi:PPK2 family polyphosphate:nucleotide phosphotransferase
MDAAGKDGTISRLISGINPQGCKVSSFKKPTPEELGHDFLWRINQKAPRKGIIGVFNRSHYEEVLVTRVHPSFIVYQNLPGIDKEKDIPSNFWMKRFDRIKSYEDRLHSNGTQVVKFFLHVSKDEQKRRLLDRMNTPDKHWKFNVNDVNERAFWDQYMAAYQDAIQHTATPLAPWYVIPADDKPTMRALVSSIARSHMEKTPLQFPNSGENILADIEEARILFDQES